MGIARATLVLLLLVSIASDAWSHHHHHRNRHGAHPERRRGSDYLDTAALWKSSFESEKTAEPARSEPPEGKKPSEVANGKEPIPFSTRRLEKMLEKAILKIIMGDLGTAEMLLLKSLNYTPEEVLAIRERELDKRKDEEPRRTAELRSNGRRGFYEEDPRAGRTKHWNYNSMEFDSSSRSGAEPAPRNERKRNSYRERTTSHGKDFDFDAYNRQAVIDYEDLASKLELERHSSWPESATSADYEDESRKRPDEELDSRNLHRSFDRAMESHVIFKIPYDDSEFDSSSGSEERSEFTGGDLPVSTKVPKHRPPSTLRHTIAKNVADSFHAPSLSTTSSSSFSSSSPSVVSSASAERTSPPVVYQLGSFKTIGPDHPSLGTTGSPIEPTSTVIADVTLGAISGTATDPSTTSDDNSSVKGASIARNTSEYEGLEWVEDDVYRVIPSFADSLAYDNPDDNETLEYGEQGVNLLPGGENDTLEYQNDGPDPVKLFMANVNASADNASLSNLSIYQQLALAHRRE